MKKALVSGGTSGIGLSVVKALCNDGYEVFFIGSNLEKGRKIESDLGQKYAVNFVHLDLSDLEAVKQFGDSFAEYHCQLDLFVASAGVILSERQQTNEGLEKTFTIGYLSTYILSESLRGPLANAVNSRIVFVSGGKSIALRMRLNFADLFSKKRYNGILAAARTVHAKAVLADILSEHEAYDVFALHPGVIKSELGRSLSWPLNKIFSMASFFSPSESKTAIWACTSDYLVGLGGHFISGTNLTRLNFDSSYKHQLVSETDSILKQFKFTYPLWVST